MDLTNRMRNACFLARRWFLFLFFSFFIRLVFKFNILHLAWLRRESRGVRLSDEVIEKIDSEFDIKFDDDPISSDRVQREKEWNESSLNEHANYLITNSRRKFQSFCPSATVGESLLRRATMNYNNRSFIVGVAFLAGARSLRNFAIDFSNTLCTDHRMNRMQREHMCTCVYLVCRCVYASGMRFVYLMDYRDVTLRFACTRGMGGEERKKNAKEES